MSDSKAKTKQQVTIERDSTDGSIEQPNGSDWYSRVDEMVKHSTIKFCRMLYVSPMLLTEWAVEGESEEAKEILEFGVLPHADTLRFFFADSLFDHGWAGFEQVLGYDEQRKINVVRKVKPLNHAITKVAVTEDTGEFAGFVNGESDTSLVTLKADQSILISSDKTGFDYYGKAELETMTTEYDESIETRKDLRRYLRKLAGTHWVVRYPTGQTPYAPNGNKLTDNGIIAKDMLTALRSNGAIALPLSEKSDSDEPEWDIKLLETSGGQTPFLEDLDAIDVRIIRGAGFPERTAFEGKHGTKAEADTHQGFGLSNIELKLRVALGWLNKTCCEPLLKHNGFPPDAAKLTIAKLSADNRKLLEDVYREAIAGHVDPDTDYDAIRSQLAVPERPEEIEQTRVDETKEENAGS